MPEPAFVSPSGHPLDIEELKRRAAATAKPKSRVTMTARTGCEHDDFMSLGFVVEGLTQGMLADARDARRREIDGYETACALAKEQHRAAPKKPVPFDESLWLQTAKHAKVRAKPFEIRSSADQLRELALKQGWLSVRVVELRRERK